MLSDIAWVKELSPGDQKIVYSVLAYFHTDIPLLDKLRQARLIATMDLEFDPIVANQGKVKAAEVLRVANLVLSKQHNLQSTSV